MGLITAIVLAAGQSKRMGTPKMLLQLGGQTVIERVVVNLLEASLFEVIVVLGSDKKKIQQALKNINCRTVYNSRYKNSSMLDSLKVGLRNSSSHKNAILIVLGDQPRISNSVIKTLIEDFEKHSREIIIPSYQHRRGHPWLFDSKYEDELLKLQEPQTLRDFLYSHEKSISYLEINEPQILEDIDTYEDYLKMSSGK
jgi:molybdenum cofactor cytidylyltransferase